VLQKAAIKVSLKEPRNKFLEMMMMLRSFGTHTVYLVHVHTGAGSSMPKSAEKMENLAVEVRKLGFKVDVMIRQGHAPSQVISISQELGVNYTGLFWLPKALLTQALIGSIDVDIIRQSNVPVFVYKHGHMSDNSRLDKILYATDFQTTDAKVMPLLVNKNFQAREIYLLHVGQRAPDPATEQSRRTRVMDNLKRLAAECRGSYTNVHTIEVVGSRRNQILRQANLNKADLIVIGKSDNPKPLSNLTGSLAEVLPRKAKRSIFIVPGYY
jgi:nucleotide-binding universal stress UspA family protein